MRSKFGDNEPQDVSYHGNAFLRLMGYIKPYWKTVALCCVLVGLLTVFDIARPRIIGDAIDKYITQQSAQDLPPETRFQGILIAAGLYVAILLLQFVCNRLQYLKIQETGQNIVYTLRNELMAHVESLSMRFFDLTPVGRIVTRITNDTEAVNDLYTNTIVRLFRNVVKIIGLAIIMMVMNFRMAMLSFVLVPVMAVLTAVFRKLSRKTYQIVKTRITTLNTFLSEHLSGMRVIQIFAREKEKCAEFEEKNESLYRAGVREMMVFAIFRPSIYFLSVIAMAIILGGGSALVLDGVISIGMLYTFTEYISQLFTPVQELAEQFTTLQSAIASAEKIFTLLDEKPMLSDKEDAKKLPAVRGKIEFDHVSFSYDNTEVLKDISFTVEPGETVVVMGETGSGKTTLAELIPRIYDVNSGEVRVDGVNVTHLKLKQLRHNIGFATQDVLLYSDTIDGNISFGDSDMPEEDVVKYAKAADADGFIRKLSDGYETIVGERGVGLSGGQKQRISLARALAVKPSILILDDTTSAVDLETEKHIQNALANLDFPCTKLIIAQRISTAKYADKIIVLKDGKISEQGTHEELIKQHGYYREVFDLQK